MAEKGSEPIKESPTLNAGSEPEVQADPTKALLEELSKIGVEKPEQIANMATASSQVGSVQNLYGEARRRIAELEAALATKSKPGAAIEDVEGQTIDLAALIEERSGKAADSAVRKIIQEMQEAQNRQYQEYNSIQADEDFDLIKDAWDMYVKTPEAQGKLQTGETSLKDLYGSVKTKYLKEMLKKSRDVLTGLQKAGGKAPLHIEGGETRSAPALEPDDERKAKLDNISKQRSEGRINSDAALESIIASILPPDDPIWRR